MERGAASPVARGWRSSVLVLAHLAGALRQEGGEVCARSPAPSIYPIYWVHIPKSGTSFGNTLVHSTCPDIPDSVVVLEPRNFFEVEEWGRRCPVEKFLRFDNGHDPLETGRPEIMSHVVVMMREPAQRILSGYYHALHDCPRLKAKYNCSNRCDGDTRQGRRLVRNLSAIPPTEYAECVDNCAANMLTGAQCDSTAPPNVSLAIANLKEAGFVGLTGEWELTVCLWHAEFGGQPLPVELRNVRPGMRSAPQGYDVEGHLGDWRPSNDAAVYRAAKERFRADLKRNGLTAEACTEWLVRAGARQRAKQHSPAAVYDED